ncbi:MAG: pyridoxamine 5'-phosphate oxidase family protein [Dehalococcoidia bacterium]|nr:pyridoxamine 5'-phosphate oxidase family protein [Dehalococcoidia bacterium]
MPNTDLTTVLRSSIEEANPRTKRIFGEGHAMSPQEVEEFLAPGPVGLISTVGPSRAPHMAPTTIFLVDGHIYFSAGKGSATQHHLQRNPKVAVAVVDPPWTRHLLVQGTVRFLEPDTEEMTRVQAFQKALRGRATSTLVAVEVRKIFTWKG